MRRSSVEIVGDVLRCELVTYDDGELQQFHDLFSGIHRVGEEEGPISEEEVYDYMVEILEKHEISDIFIFPCSKYESQLKINPYFYRNTLRFPNNKGCYLFYKIKETIPSNKIVNKSSFTDVGRLLTPTELKFFDISRYIKDFAPLEQNEFLINALTPVAVKREVKLTGRAAELKKRKSNG